MNLKLWNKTIKFCQNYNFLMFEIVLALLVIMVGAFGVSSMFPVGMSSQKEAVGNSYVTDAAEQLLRLNASYIRNDWDWLNVFANAKPGTNDQGREWNSSALFQVNSLRVKADAAFDANSDSNSGLFLLEQMTLNQVDHSAIVRLWKDVTENDNGSFDAKIYAEVSWPADKPYYAREKEVFSLQVSKAPEISIASTAYSSSCAVTRDHGAGYSTTIASVLGNGDGTYTIELAVNHDGCSGSACPELTHFSVEADYGSYTLESLSGIVGILDAGPDIGEDFQGFKIDSISGIGNGTAGTFIITYTLTSLQDQEMVAHGGGNAYSVMFDVADFEYVLSCTNQGSNFTATAVDDGFTLPSGGGMSSFSAGGSSSDYETLVVPAPGVLVNDTTSDGSQLTAILVSGTSYGTIELNPDGSFTYVPGSDFTGQDSFTYRAFNGIKLTEIAQVTIIASDPNVDFDIIGDDVVPSNDSCATFTVLGAAMSGGCGTWQVTSRIKIGNETFDPWGDFNSAAGNVNDGNNPRNYTHSALIPANTAVSVLGKAYDCDGNPQGIIGDSSANGQQVVTLRNGDQAPTVGGYDGQASALDFLAGYINSDNIVVLEENQAIYLMELYATDQNASNFDLQDLVVLVTLNDASTCGAGEAGTPGGGSSSGCTGDGFNINPGTSSNMQFCLTGPGGSINRGDLADGSVTSYDGTATSVFVRPKSFNGESILINGAPYTLYSNWTYEITGDLDVHLHNTQPGLAPVDAMGHWYICITGENVNVVETNKNASANCP